TFGEKLVVFLAATDVGMAAEDQVGVGSISQILLEVCGERVKSDRLAGHQTARGLCNRGLCRREVDAMQGQLEFQLMNLRRFLNLDAARGIGSAASAVVH